jgi:hypothetical protein
MPPPPPSPRVPGNAFYEYEWWTGDGGGVDVFEARLAGPYSDRTALDADVFGLMLLLFRLLSSALTLLHNALQGFYSS